MAAEKHDQLETWQLAVGIATGIVGLLYYARKPAPATREPSPTTVGPSGFGEVAGGGGGSSPGVWPTPGQPAPPQGGQQSPPTEPKPLPIGEAGPGESAHEYEERGLREQQQRITGFLGVHTIEGRGYGVSGRLMSGRPIVAPPGVAARNLGLSA